MKIVNEMPLSVIQKQKEEKAIVPLTIDALGLQLVQGKLDHSQTKQLVNFIGQELVQAKLDIAILKGGNA